MTSYLCTRSLSRFANRESIVQLVETFHLHPYISMYRWRIFQSWILKFLQYWNFSIWSITFLSYIFTLWCCWDFDRARRLEYFDIKILPDLEYQKFWYVFCPYSFYRDMAPRTATHRNVAAQGDQHIRDQRVKLYQGICNIPGLRRKIFPLTFTRIMYKSKIV